MCGQKEMVWSSLLSTGLFLLLLPFCQQQCSLLVRQIRALIQLKNNSHDLHALLTIFLCNAILFKLYCYQCTALQDLPTSQSIYKSLTYVSIDIIVSIDYSLLKMSQLIQDYLFLVVFMAVRYKKLAVQVSSTILVFHKSQTL